MKCLLLFSTAVQRTVTQCIDKPTPSRRRGRSLFTSKFAVLIGMLLTIGTSTRGQGRSPYQGFTSFHYDDMARDVIAILDHLEISKVAVVGWSDGAMTGLNLAMNYTDRIDRVFAYGAQAHFNQSFPGKNDPIINSATGTLHSNFETNGTTVAEQKVLKRQEGGEEFWCESISPFPNRCVDMYAGVLA